MPPNRAAVPAILLLLSACSHGSPYYGPGPREAVGAHGADPAAPSAPLVRQRLILIGDAGDPDDDGEPVLLALRDTAANLPERTVVAFLGDNAYEEGLPAPEDSDHPEAERRLRAQIDVVLESGSRGVFIPGNHDWDEGRETGYRNVMRMQALVEGVPGDRIRWLPGDGCPGPAILDGLDGMHLFILDTQWWFHDGYLPGEACAPADTALALRSLRELVATAGDWDVVVLGHHPLRTRGIHGGFSSWKEHLFPLTEWKGWLWLPLPVIGSVYPLAWKPAHRLEQDLDSDDYRAFRRQMEAALATRPPLIYASGHTHSLEVFRGRGPARYLLVSGAGSESKITQVGHLPSTLFAHAHAGFMVVDLLRDGRVLLRVVEPGDEVEDRVVLSWWLR